MLYEEFLHATIPGHHHLSDFINFISIGGREGGGSELDSRSDPFKTIARHKLVGTNWASTEDIYRVLSKILRPVCARVCFYRPQNPNKPEEITKVSTGVFNSYVDIYQNDSIEKRFRQEKYRLCRVSQDIDEFFVRPIKFFYIFSIACFPHMVYNITFPYIFMYFPVSIFCSDWFVLGCWKYIIIKFVAIFQKSVYILFSRCIHRIITGIVFKCKIPPSSFYSQTPNTCYSLPSLNNLNQLWTHFNSCSSKSSCFMKINSCSHLVTLLASLWIIIIPPSASQFYLLE